MLKTVYLHTVFYINPIFHHPKTPIFIMKNTILFSLLSLFQLSIYAQSEWIEGQILDAETDYPLPYSNVYIPSSKEGMFANDEGIFRIKNEGITDTDSIWFSHLGYEDVRTTIAILKQKGNVIKSKPTQYSLHEVVITPLHAKQMLQEALANTKDNYPEDFSKVRMLFKEFSKRNGHRSHYSYFDLDAYIETYQGKKTNVYSRVYDYEIYDKKGEYSFSFKPTDIVQFAMVENTFREDRLKNFEFTYLGSTNYEGAELDVIGFKNKPDGKNDFANAKGRVFITKEKKAIQYVEMNIESFRSKRFFLVAKMDTLNVVAKIAFKPVEDLYAIDYAVQTTYAKGKVFGKNENLVYSTTMKTKEQKLHLKPEEVYKEKEVERIIKKQAPKDISLLKEDPDMRLK